MSDYVQQLEKQNEELKQKLADKENELDSVYKQLDDALGDVAYYRDNAKYDAYDTLRGDSPT